MNSHNKKIAAAKAYDFICSKDLPTDSIIGIGTGSTVNYFIEFIAESQHQFGYFVSSSQQSTALLEKHNIKVTTLSALPRVAIDYYIDGTDEFDPQKNLIKGGGGALTGEKILTSISKQFICIADTSKAVARLGQFPLPIEYVAYAEATVYSALEQLGGTCSKRSNYVTDYGNPIVDVFNLSIDNPLQMEQTCNTIPGVVTNGIFANNRPNFILTN